MTTRIRVPRRPERKLPAEPDRPAGSVVNVPLKETGELNEAHELQVQAAALPLFDVHGYVDDFIERLANWRMLQELAGVR
jgi:hypothetical protein